MSKKLSTIYDELDLKEKIFINNKIQEYLIDPMISKESLTKNISENTHLTTDRHGITRLMKYLNIEERSANIIKESKKLKSIEVTHKESDINFNKILQEVESKYSRNDLVEIYHNSSLKMLSEILNTTVYYTELILKHFSIPKKEIKTYKEIIEILFEKGISKELVEKEYLDKEKSFNDFKDFLTSHSKYEITDTSTYRLLKHLNIIKPNDVIAYQQGKKSRAELLRNLGKLEKAGFKNREDLAKYYEDNKNLTKQSLVKELNEKIDEEFFTMRWLGRHLDPFLSEDRLKGVSRVEKEFQNFIIEMMGEDKVLLNDWSMISPYQLDVVIPEHNIAIEFNGNYWHSDKFIEKNHHMTAVEYHQMKELLCKEKGFTLLFVWEYDWYDFHDEVKESLSKVLLHNNSIDELLLKKEYVA